MVLGFTQDGAEPPRGRWSEGVSIDGNGTFSLRPMEPQGHEPDLGTARPRSTGGAKHLLERIPALLQGRPQ